MGIGIRSCDVLIVGGGLAGLQAAVTLRAKAPQKKIIIADLGGGASSEVMGFCAPVVSGDSPDCFADDTLKAGGGENDPSLFKRLCSDATDVLKSLEEIGIAFDRRPDGSYDLLRSLGSSFPRVAHYKTITGETAIEKYRESLKCPEVEFHKARIVKLFTKNGRIAGALGFENGAAVAYNTPCVVMATGGGAGLYAFSTWTKMLQGSGYAMALSAGAQLTGMKRVQFEPCVAVYPKKFCGFPIITTMLFEGAKLIDGKGRNVLPPNTPVPAKRGLAELISAAVADGGDCGHGGVWFDFSGVPEEVFKTKYPEYYRKLRGISEDYGNLRIEVKPAAHTTLGGIKITDNAAASVPGLFAAGEASGGIHGRDRIGGNAGLEVFVFGRAAGMSAAKYKAEAVDITHDCEAFISALPVGTSSRRDILENIGKLLDSHAGVLRNAEESAECLEQLKKLRADLIDNPPKSREEFMVCANALTAAEQLAKID